MSLLIGVICKFWFWIWDWVFNCSVINGDGGEYDMEIEGIGIICVVDKLDVIDFGE